MKKGRITNVKSMLAIACFFSITSACAQIRNHSNPGSSIIIGNEELEVGKSFDVETVEPPFSHLDLGVTAGTTGIGLDLSTQINNSLCVRTGFSFMPSWHYKMNFGVQVGEDEATSHSKFEKLSGLLSQFTGHKVDDQIDMIGRPTYSNFKLLLDVYPLRNKHWHFTGGFYWGKSEIGDAYNTTEDMSSLMAVCIYNNLYDRYNDDIPLYNDFYIDPAIGEKFINYGRMGIHLGDYAKDIYDGEGNLLHKKGDPYIVEPDKDCMVKARAKVNSFKPYLGFGYGGSLLKNSDKYHISFDCGVLFWGGTPSVITHDGTDLTKDVEHVRGKVGDYVDIAKCAKVFPVIELRLTRKLF